MICTIYCLHYIYLYISLHTFYNVQYHHLEYHPEMTLLYLHLGYHFETKSYHHHLEYLLEKTLCYFEAFYFFLKKIYIILAKLNYKNRKYFVKSTIINRIYCYLLFVTLLKGLLISMGGQNVKKGMVNFKSKLFKCRSAS